MPGQRGGAGEPTSLTLAHPGHSPSQPGPICPSPPCHSASAQTLRPAPRSLSGSGSAGPGLGSRLRLSLTRWVGGSGSGAALPTAPPSGPPSRVDHPGSRYPPPPAFRRGGSSFRTQVRLPTCQAGLTVPPHKCSCRVPPSQPHPTPSPPCISLSTPPTPLHSELGRETPYHLPSPCKAHGGAQLVGVVPKHQVFSAGWWNHR